MHATSWLVWHTDLNKFNLGRTLVVWCVMGDSKGYCANWSKGTKFGKLLDFHMLYPNLPGAKANSQWCCHLGRFKMAVRHKMISFLLVSEQVMIDRLRVTR